MIVDLSPGDRVCVGDAVTLIVLSVEDGLVRFALEQPSAVPAPWTAGNDAAVLRPWPGLPGTN